MAVLLEMMRENGDDVVVQRRGCAGLVGAAQAHLLFRDADSGRVAPVIDAALTALHAHVSDAALVSSAMKLLCLCADPCAEALRLATGVRVVQATEAAMRAHAGLSALQVAGVRVFGAWYHRCEALLHEVVDAGGIESSVAVMHAFAADADTQIAGLYVLLDVVRHVAPMDPLVNRIVNAGALPVVSASYAPT